MVILCHFPRGELKVDVRPDHICSTKKESKILCIDGNGMFTIYILGLTKLLNQL